MDVVGKVALVTGATRGIGQAIAARLKDAGAEIAVTGRDEVLLQAWRDQGVLAAAADVTDVRQVEDVVQAVVERYGRLTLWSTMPG